MLPHDVVKGMLNGSRNDDLNRDFEKRVDLSAHGARLTIHRVGDIEEYPRGAMVYSHD